MKKNKTIRKPIGFKVFVVIMLVVVFQSIALYVVLSTQFKNELVKEKKEDIQNVVINLQDTLQYLASKNETAQIQRTITSLGASVDSKSVLLLDESNKVIASTHIEYIANDIDSLLKVGISDVVKRNIAQAKNNLKNIIWESVDRKSLYAISPIVLGRLSTDSIRSNRLGALFLHYDMQWIDKKNQQALINVFLPIVILLIIAGLGLAVYFNILIGVRIKFLNDFTRKLAKGIYSERVELSDNDEISDLGLAFNDMAQEIQKNHKNLLAREQDLAITLNSIGDAVITTDESGHVTRMNPVAIELTGWSLSEAHGRKIIDVFPIINATTRQPIQNPIEKVMSTGNTVYLSNHTTLIAKDGTEFQIADSAAPIRDENNNIRGMVLIFNDVTEQYKLRKASRESEERFRQFSENVNEVFWIASLDWKTVFYVNSAYEKIWGHTPEALYKNPRLWIDAVHPDDRTQLINSIPKYISDIVGYIDFKKYRIQRADGKIIWIKAKAYPIHDNTGKVTRIAGIAEDISEQVNMEEILWRTQKMDALGKLTGGVAHDYNNMLGVVLGYAELLADELTEQPKLAKYAQQIVYAGKRGARLTKKLLAFSSQKKSEADSVNLNDFLLKQQHMLEKTLTARIKLVFNLLEKVWPIWVDSSEMEDVILNMSINAMHAIKENGQLTISTSNEVIDEWKANSLAIKPGNYVLLSIADTGCGMTDVVREKIFEPFFSTKGEQGTGLGLSQVYGFVQRSNGAIRASSELGKGALFEFYFPQYTAEDHKGEANKDSKSVDFKGVETILIIDDEPSLLSLTSEVLSQHGFNVICANSPKQVFDILEREEVNVLVSDIIMPEMDGYELTAKVKEKYPEIKIQLISGFANNGNEGLVDEKLQNEILYKPFSSQALLQKVHELLNK